ncbi:hypothetical protein ACFXDJ_17805 [Streptomyces sp. NPDC059443]|uniref:hypothetical protein n=1 Tax=unclassified Streptomyces TaxID=2593676 RepID=UPI00368EC499
MNTSAPPPAGTVGARRVPLDRIDVRGARAAANLSRILPRESGRLVQAPIFNSAL